MKVVLKQSVLILFLIGNYVGLACAQAAERGDPTCLNN